MPNIGPLELVVVLVVVLLIFGPKRLPGFGRSLGSGMREFKDSLTMKVEEEERDQLTSGTRDAGVTDVARPRGEAEARGRV